jgi:predicted amidohydrolase YtcJ
VTTLDLDSSLRALSAKRTELLKQVDAIDTALAALAAAGITAVNAPETQPGTADDVPSPLVPRRVKARRVLSDEHRQALLDGRRMARHRRAVDEGRARELLAPSPASSTAAGLPRLVKRAK